MILRRRKQTNVQPHPLLEVPDYRTEELIKHNVAHLTVRPAERSTEVLTAVGELMLLHKTSEAGLIG